VTIRILANIGFVFWTGYIEIGTGPLEPAHFQFGTIQKGTVIIFERV
jgi:hypothetical protein